MTYHAHVEATFESAHMADVPDHKCTGTLPGLTLRVRDRIGETLERLGVSQGIIHQTLLSLKSDILMDFHGHSWLCEIEWNYTEHQIDEHFWGPDFGKVKDLIRTLDHHNLNLIFTQPTAEFLAQHLFKEFEYMFGFKPDFVKLHEGRGNTVIYRGE